jgi:hypothetical protein
MFKIVTTTQNRDDRSCIGGSKLRGDLTTGEEGKDGVRNHGTDLENG